MRQEKRKFAVGDEDTNLDNRCAPNRIQVKITTPRPIQGGWPAYMTGSFFALASMT
jgi:hypothetical protein